MQVLPPEAAGRQPWRCLCLGSRLQMTITRPWRRMTLQCSQMGLTEGLTFMGWILSLSSYRP
jgi:hypothetical protein